MATDSVKQDTKTPELEKCLETLRKLESELQDQGVLHAHIFRDVTRGARSLPSDVNIIVEIRHGIGFGTFKLMELEDKLTRKFHHRVCVISEGGLKSPRHDHIRKEMKQAF